QEPRRGADPARRHAGRPRLEGNLDLDLKLAGRAASPTFQASARLKSGRLEGLGDIELESLTTHYDGKNLDLDFRATQRGAPLAYGSGRIPLDLYRASLRPGPITYNAEVDKLDLEKLGALLPPSLQDLRGKLTLSASTGGTREEPHING